MLIFMHHTVLQLILLSREMMKQRSEGWTDQACPVLTRSLALSSSTPFSLVSSPLAGSSSHNGRLVWVFLLGQIEVSLLPLFTMERGTGGVQENRKWVAGEEKREDMHGEKINLV